MRELFFRGLTGVLVWYHLPLYTPPDGLFGKGMVRV